MPTSNIERLRLFYAQFNSGDRVLVLINADPDAIAGAMAVKRLLWKKVASVTVASINVVERPDNVAMVRLLNVKLVHVDAIKAEQFDRFVIVDSQPAHNESFAGFPINVVIDHHPVEKSSRAGFVDIRPTYGATSSMMIEYLKAAKIKPAIKLATALYLGIKVDTSNFERRVLVEDVRAFQFIYKYANVHLARRIEQEEIKRDYLKYFSRALDRRTIKNNRIFVHLGQVESPDVCVILADFFMRVSAIRWTVVSGEYNQTLIVIFRSDGISGNAGEIADRLFGSMGTAGGHKGLARAEVGLDVFRKQTGLKSGRQIQDWLKKQL